MMSTTDRIVVVDGVTTADGTVALDADDPGLLVGLGVFETLRTYGRQAFRVDAHLERLCQSAATLGVPMPALDLLAEEIATVTAMRTAESVVRVTLTAGGRRIVRAGPLPPVLAAYRCVTRLWTPPSWLPGTVKHNSRAASVVAVNESGADEVIWVDADGHLLEGTRSNVFAVRGEVLCTPPLDGRLLAGVTRDTLLAVARDIGIAVRVAPLLCTGPFDELYLSSTLKELSPIAMLDGEATSGAGPTGDKVRAAFAQCASAHSFGQP